LAAVAHVAGRSLEVNTSGASPVSAAPAASVRQ
jgi:hypothetical protein